MSRTGLVTSGPEWAAKRGGILRSVPDPLWRAIRLSVFALTACASYCANAQWTVANLHPAGAIESMAYGVDGSQQVGYARVGEQSRWHATLWNGNAASWVDLHPAGTDWSYAFGVSDGKQVGRAFAGGAYRASLWSGTGASWVNLHPTGAFNSQGFGIAGGQQVGVADNACLWTGTAGSWVNLHPNGATESAALSTDGNQQVGVALFAGQYRASLWSGTQGSRVDLHPVVATRSWGSAVSGGQQVGDVYMNDHYHASLWSGSAASWVNLHPAAASDSWAHSVHAGTQVGAAVVAGVTRASLWSGTAASWVDLHAFLPEHFSGSRAYGVWRSGATTFVVGYGVNTQTLREEALMWMKGPVTLGVRSANPSAGVPMTVWTADINGLKNGSTSFNRTYNQGTSASVTAPPSVGTQWFDHWQKDTVPLLGGQRTITVLMDAPHMIKAIYRARRTLSVASLNPDAGVPITVWTIDKNGQSNGTTHFTRLYAEGTSVSLTAPAIVGNSAFRRWDLDGAPWQTTRTVTLPMSADRTLRAVYVACQTLSVTSATVNVPVTVWTTDVAGQRNGTTNFTRLYQTGSNASLTAPASAGGRSFRRWEKNGVPVPGINRTVTVTLTGPITMNAVYAP